jgi:glutaryl-CoA dehydrogenase
MSTTAYPTLKFGHSETTEAIRDTVHQFAQDKIAPIAADIDKSNQFPRDLWPEMGALGLHGITVSEEQGGLGLGYLEHLIAIEEVSRASASIGLSYGAHSNLCINQIERWGNAEQKAKYLPKLVSGEWVGCFGLTEPDSGSDPASMRTTAKRTDNGYVLSGSKMWITNSPIADVFVVWAKLDGEIRGFVLEKGMKGLSAPKIDGKFSLRASITGEIVMDGVEVSEDHIFPEVKGLKGPFSCLNKARYGIAWGSLGAADFCWHAARQYTLERSQFGRPLAANQLIQKKLADMQTEISLGLLGCLQAGRELDNGTLNPIAISLIKRNSCGKALDIARQARDMHGGNGIADEYHVIRHVMNLEAVNTYEGTHDIHALILGRSQTDIPAF